MPALGKVTTENNENTEIKKKHFHISSFIATETELIKKSKKTLFKKNFVNDWGLWQFRIFLAYFTFLFSRWILLYGSILVRVRNGQSFGYKAKNQKSESNPFQHFPWKLLTKMWGCSQRIPFYIAWVTKQYLHTADAQLNEYPAVTT